METRSSAVTNPPCPGGARLHERLSGAPGRPPGCSYCRGDRLSIPCGEGARAPNVAPSDAPTPPAGGRLLGQPSTARAGKGLVQLAE